MFGWTGLSPTIKSVKWHIFNGWIKIKDEWTGQQFHCLWTILSTKLKVNIKINTEKQWHTNKPTSQKRQPQFQSSLIADYNMNTTECDN